MEDVWVQASWDKLTDLNKGGFLIHRISTESWNETYIREPRMSFTACSNVPTVSDLGLISGLLPQLSSSYFYQVGQIHVAALTEGGNNIDDFSGSAVTKKKVLKVIKFSLDTAANHIPSLVSLNDSSARNC